MLGGAVLLKHQVIRRIAAGEIGCVYRRWKRPTVKAGGSLKTALGVLAIESVDRVAMSKLSLADAKDAGYESRRALLDALRGRDGTTYRIGVRMSGPDPRVALRGRAIESDSEMAEVAERLGRMDRASRGEPWTRAYLEVIERAPATLAADLAESIGTIKKPFKARVRRLKELGLTESLETGYQLSARGQSYLARLRGGTS